MIFKRIIHTMVHTDIIFFSDQPIQRIMITVLDAVCLPDLYF